MALRFSKTPYPRRRQDRLALLSRYYRSPYWQMTRARLIYERGGKCEKCGSTRQLQAHHLHYDYLFTEQSHMDCLQLLCARCHALEESRKRRKRR